MTGLFKRKVYLDNNATTCVSRPVRKTMNRVLKHHWGNPSSGYQIGKTAFQVIGQAREQVANAIHAHSHEIYFTGCATESNKEICRIAKAHNVLVMSDCVQAFGKIPLDVKELGVDYASFSAHKLYGPKGIGALYAKISCPLEPFIHGGHQEEGMRAGTESVHNIAGFGKACREVDHLLARSDKIRLLKEQFIDKLKIIKPDIIINSPPENCLPNTISVTFPNTNSRELMMMLDYYGISVSSGSACSSQSNKPSHVLKAIGLSDKAAEETIRVSLGKELSERDIRYTIKIIDKYLKTNKI